MKKEIIVMTCSEKHWGYCVVGIDTAADECIRLVVSDELDIN